MDILYPEDYDFLCTLEAEDDICIGNCKDCYQVDTCPDYEEMNEDD